METPTRPAPPLQPLTRPTQRREVPAWARGIFAGLFLYLFLSAINVMGHGLKDLGQSTDWIDRVLAHGDNPFIALMGAVLITAIVQSSSFTTSLIITMVAVGELKVETAVYMVMGANIGTSVTNIIVSLGSARIRRQFRRAFTAALVHDIFNLLTVLLLFPLEWVSSTMSESGHGLLTRMSLWIADGLGLQAMAKPTSPIKVVTAPVVDTVAGLAGLVTTSEPVQGTLVAIIGLLLLFVSLYMLVSNLKGALLRRIEQLFRSVFFRNDSAAYSIGVITTVLVQSSSVTTSLIVPLAAAGAVKLRRVFPYTLGANLGTTITGVIAATANPAAAAVAVATSHVTFNLIGTAIWYPLRVVPMSLARSYGRLAARSRRYALLFLLGVFIIVPIVGILITELLLDVRGVH